MAEFDYQPTKCKKTYRVVVVWKDLEVTKGQTVLFDDTRCFFYITNDWESAAEEIVFEANDRCNQENLIEQLKSGVHALTAPVDNLESNWAYMVMASLAWSLKAWAALLLPEQGRWKEQTSTREVQVAANGLRHVPQCVHQHPGSDRSHGPADRLSTARVEPLAARVLPPARPIAAAAAMLGTRPHEAGVRMLRYRRNAKGRTQKGTTT